MDEKNENNRKAKRESDHQKDVKELMRLWIQKLKVEADEEEARTAIAEWEYENNMLQTEGPEEGEYDWQFQYEHA